MRTSKKREFGSRRSYGYPARGRSVKRHTHKKERRIIKREMQFALKSY